LVSEESCFLRSSGKEAPIPSKIPVDTEKCCDHLSYEKVPEGIVAYISFFGYSKHEINSWWSEFAHIFQAINELHFVVLQLPFVNALPVSPPIWQVCKCNDPGFHKTALID